MDKAFNDQKANPVFWEDYVKVEPYGWKNVQNQIVAERAHNQMVRVGWQNGERIHCAVFYVDLVGGKVVVQENRFDVPIVEKLVDMSIRGDDIRPAFQEEFAKAA